MDGKKNDNFKIIIWLNGKDKHHAFHLEMTPNINTMRKLKEAIAYEKNPGKSNIDKMVLFNYKGIEIEESDIAYFEPDQVIYLSPEGQKFNILNYADEYEFVKNLKTGGYAEVYLAKHAITNKLVSVKKTDLHNFSTEELYNISREAVYLSTLIHKNIIKMTNSYTYNDFLYNVMDFAEGGELSQLLLDDTPIPEDNIKNIFFQIHNAVKFMHTKNVIHRDLKPNNILFLDKEQTQVVIIDFGISGICNGMSREEIKAGTIRYVPPELASGDVYACSPKIDVWSLGIILYLMYFKTFPFEGNDDEILEKIANEPVVFPGKIKIRKSLIPLIEGMLRKNPNARIEISSILFDDWLNDDSDEFEYYEEKKVMNPPKSTLFSQQPKQAKSVNNKKQDKPSSYLKPVTSRVYNLKPISSSTMTQKIDKSNNSPSKYKNRNINEKIK